MKNRLPALDGLRGFAAFSVLLSHTGFSPALITTLPFVLTAYQIFAVGPNSVQILFVLSGFLMAFLYPTLPRATYFIKKRYARIFPVYTVIVIFLWLLTVFSFGNAYYLKFIILFLFAAAVFVGWKLIKKSPLSSRAAKILFWSFVVLQSIVILFNFFITPHFIIANTLTLPEFTKNVLIMLSNVTLTTPFIRDIPRMSSVFWSLAPEVLFYLVYPFIVIPLIHLGKRLGILFTLFLIIGTTKILFDLDYAVVSTGALYSMNIARASGFVAGVVIGTIYQSKGKLWEKIFPVVSNPIFGIAVLILFIANQWGDGAIRDGQSVVFMNLYYLVSSWIIALVILNAIIPQTITYKIFSNKILVFLGLISYSLYLIHVEVISWIKDATAPFSATGLLSIIPFLLMIIAAVGVSWMLFSFIESLYFASKKQIAPEKKVITHQKPVAFAFSKRKTAVISAATIVILFFLYAGSYSPTFLVTRHSLASYPGQELPLLSGKVAIPFTATSANLSALYLRLRYAKSAGDTVIQKKNPAQLALTIFDTNGQKIFTYSRLAYDVEGSPLYGFGLPTILNSANKTYRVELSLINGDPTDQVFVDTSPTSFVSVYTNSKTALLHNPFTFLLNRIIFVFTNPGFLFAFGFVLLVTFLQPILGLLKHDRK